MRLVHFCFTIFILFCSCTNNSNNNASTETIRESSEPTDTTASTEYIAPPVDTGTVINNYNNNISTSPYRNGNRFKVLRFVYTDLDENILDRNDNVKKTSLIIDNEERLISVVMDTIYSEYYYYNKVDRVIINGKTQDWYSIYKSYNTQNPGTSLTDIIILEVNPATNELLSYKLYFGKKGFITFYLQPMY